ncbi:tRNA dihydrouridine synthase DusB [Erysipelotrichaceae bacterium OttesenSCG-928-M19]|nr:tRNA dihydrouridine synthase DusB [Erysipelotrichaceae bacterium OttesenSCG-928-M19]
MLEIGGIKLESQVIIAPMAGITNKPFRQVLRKYLDGLICAEMVSDKGLYYENKKTLSMIEVAENEGYISMQIFGGDVASLVNAAKFIDQNSNCTFIDINMGCPVKKVVKTGGGANLLNDVDKISEIVSNVVAVVNKPVTVKIRLGYDSTNINYLEVGKVCEKAGASAITLHARTRSQMYEGRADWQAIKLLKEQLKIPVIGNGDITTLDDAIAMLEETKCDGIMIGRGILGNPWLAQEIEHYLKTGECLEKPTYQERIAQAIEHLESLVETYGEKIGVVQMRSHGAWYLKGLTGNGQARRNLNKAQTKEEMLKVFNDYLKELENIQ